jgi:hypothetical protein
VKVLVICRPRPGVGPAEVVAHAHEERAALAQLRDDGLLLEAWSPGGPGAILLFDGSRERIEHRLEAQPLERRRAIETEVMELAPFALFASPDDSEAG